MTTKSSSILVCPVVALRQIPPGEVEVIRRFLFDHIQGMDRENNVRWRRLWGRMWRAEPGEGFMLYNGVERSGPFHRRHRAILQSLFDSQDRFRDIDKLHDWMKVGSGFVDWEPGKDHKPVAIPKSTSFETCSDDEIRAAHTAMTDFLHQPRSQRYLWKHLKPQARIEMLDAVMADPMEQQ